MNEFHYLLPEQVQHYWPNMLGWLRAVPEMWEGLSPELIYEYLMTGDFAAWAIEDEGGIKMVVVTQTVQHVTRRVLWVRFAFGREVDKFLPMGKDGFEFVARRLKCDVVMFTGRRGWVKKLSPFGWKEVSVNMSFEVGKQEGTVQ